MRKWLIIAFFAATVISVACAKAIEQPSKTHTQERHAKTSAAKTTLAQKSVDPSQVVEAPTPIVEPIVKPPAFPDPNPSAEKITEGLEAFTTVYDVAMHPRCINCHPSGNTPLEGDQSKPHSMNVQRGPNDFGRSGMQCANCHHQRTVDVEGSPPGGNGALWRLAPWRNAFQGKSPRQLALMFKDRRRSLMDSHALLLHAGEDALLKTAWNPGGGRTPVPVPHEDFLIAFYTWIDAGMPVPEEKKE